jgi:DNA polymerase elongation subunit (family B)
LLLISIIVHFRDYLPFSLLYVNVYTLLGNITSEDQVMMIRTRYEDVHDFQQQNEETSFDNKEEKNILEEFCNYLQAKDPDIIIVSVGDHYLSTVLDYLFARMEKLGLDFLQLGREENSSKIRTLKHPGLKWIRGRLFISSRNNRLSALGNFGLAGVIERCRFSFLTLDLAAKYSINCLIDSRNCYELIQRGFVVVIVLCNNHEHIRTIEELVSRDKGGMIISPQTGLHENVMVLDYDSEYANLIVNHNLSYETILKGEEQVSKPQGKQGLLPMIVEKYLKRRLYFKGLLKELPENSKECLWCQQRIDS